MPGATPDQVRQAAEKLKFKLEPARLNDGPLKDIAPFRLIEIDESALLLSDYWQRHNAAPPSIQSRGLAISPSPPSQVLLEIASTKEETGDGALELGNETEIRKRELIGPQEPKFNFSFFLFKCVDGQVSPHADVLKSRSIVGLILLGLLWVIFPLALAKLLAFFWQGMGVDNWLAYVTMLCQIVPICFVAPLVIYEYAFFRQLQFPFAGALRKPLEEAIEDCIERLTVKSPGNFAGWTVEKKLVEKNEDGLKGSLVASYAGFDGDSPLPLRLYLEVEEVSSQSSFLVYWFELDWPLLFKGRAVSRIKSARFELDRLIKES